MSTPNLPRIVIKILNDLDEYFKLNNIPHVIVGGIVVNIWGRTRTTGDVDVIIDHHSLNIKDFVKYLTEKGYSASEYEFEEGFKEGGNITVFYETFRIDLVGLFRESQATQIKNAIKLNLFDWDLKFDSPETLIANKLYYGSLQDLEDALSIYTRNDLNLKKLREFCEELGVTKKLRVLERISKEELTEVEIEAFLDELDGLL